MPTDLETHPEPAMSTLVRGIIEDAQDLLKQQMDLFKTEVREDFRKSKEVAVSVGIGAAVAYAGVLFLGFMFVHLLNWAFALPLWGCYAWVGGVMAAAGVGLLAYARARSQTFNPLPDETAQAIKETVEWKTKPR